MPEPHGIDPEALLRHAPWLQALALRLCADAHGADDAVQETWKAALRSPPRSGTEARGFLARTLRNALAGAARRDGRRRRREDAAARAQHRVAPDTAELVARAELHQRLGELVLALPEPSREVVLRHYYHGESVAEVAARLGTTPDAVRAHLRRARERLRAELGRERGSAGRAFALLLAARRPAAPAALATPSTTLFAAWLTMKSKLALAGLAAATALALSLPFLGPESSNGAGPGGARPAAASAAPLAAAEAPADAALDAGAAREVVPTVSADPVLVRGRLVGLLPELPWSAELAWEVEGTEDGWREHGSRSTVAEDGTFELVLPAWSRVDPRLELELRAADPSYLPLAVDLERLPDGELEVYIEPIGRITGTVVDARGEPVPAAWVAAVEPDVDPSGPAREWSTIRAETNTAADGTFELLLPTAGEVLVVAVPMQPASISGYHMVGPGGAIADSGQPRDDLLPVCCTAATRFGSVLELQPLRMEDPVAIRGRVALRGGAPLAGVRVVWLPCSIDVALFLRGRDLGRWGEGALARAVDAESDANGTFTLRVPPGRPGRCFVTSGERRAQHLVEPIEVAGPAEVAFEVDLVTVRVTRAGEPVEGVEIAVDTMSGRRRTTRVVSRRSSLDEWRVDTMSGRLEPMRTDEHGEFRLLRNRTGSAKLVVRAPGHPERWVDVPEHGTLAVELEPVPVGRLELDFEAEHRVRQIDVVLERLDSEAVPIRTGRFRNDSDAGRFVFEVPAGRWRVHCSAPARAERRDTFLVATAFDVDVPSGGAVRTVPIHHGGRVRVVVTDTDGRLVAGSARLVGAGDETRFGLPEGTGESSNAVPGSYELFVTTPGGRSHRQGVEVVPLEVTEVRVRVPPAR